MILALTAMFTAVVPDSSVYAATSKTWVEDPIVIVLDPGHGGIDGGAVARWGGKVYREKTLNLAIAKACKAKLEEYAGVEVYLTRSTDRYVSLSGRVQYAQKKNADLFVSLHNNASLRSSDNGACVFYPNSGYKAKIGSEGKEAALCIQKQLVALGLKNKGIAIRNSENNTKYPDKSKADYYRVIKESKQAGFPGLIVEHAFVSNAKDCKSYLSTAAKLKKLGVADAKGIAEYFGLVKETVPKLKTVQVNQDKTVSLYWNSISNMQGYCVYRRAVGEKNYTCIAKLKGANVTEYSDTDVKPEITYEYAICAYYKGRKGVMYTSLSNTESVLVPLAVPEEFTAKVTDEGTVDLSWMAVSGADGYILERRSDSEEEFVQLAELTAAAEPEYQDISVCTGESYEYRVCAFVKQGKEKVTGGYSQISLVEVEK